MDTVFERVIGLGSDCATKRGINLFFTPSQPWLKTKKGHSDLFDWLIIKDYRLLADAFFRNLDDFFELQDFIFPGTPINSKYNMDWCHLGHKLDNNGDWNRQETTMKTHDDFIRLFDDTKNKIEYLKKKFINSQDKNAIYIITEDKRWNKEIDLSTLIYLRDSITHIRNGNKNFCLVLSSENPKFESFENILVIHSLSPWNGNYVNILSNFKFTSNIWA
ncbi:MAG: hypothetical protein C0432_04880 [Candidatus Puniceispirillum sp.]|nr:hypothetical protein [Candidatus Pelagibacter sp.]MBA4283608.1 hypothetical protein [Candidatus Puniceispirillum sp.]